MVFGVWDSRNTQAKLPRVVASTIRAYNVRPLTRSAVYAAPIDYSKLEVFSEEDKEKPENDAKNPLSKRGFVNALASASHGGVIADGGIRRDATLSIAALRLLHAGKDEQKTLTLRRYILGLSLVAFTANRMGYLRQGCLLVINPDLAREFVEVHPDGRREKCGTTHEYALEYATEAAAAFGVSAPKNVSFAKELAKRDVTDNKANPDAKGKGKGKKGASKDVSTAVAAVEPESEED